MLDILIALVVVALSGCRQAEAPGDALAVVNGRKILRSEVEKVFQAQSSGSPQKPTEEQAQSVRLSILSSLIDSQILMQRAEKLGLLATDEEVEAKLTEIKAPYTQEQFDAQLKQRNMTIDDLKRDLRRSITAEKVLNREITSKISISDADIAAYYNSNKSEFNLIEPQYHLAHVMVTTQPNPQLRNVAEKARNEAEARQKIQMILNRLNSGEDFATVAMRYSEDPQTGPSGGDLGFIPESSMQQTDPVTRQAVANLRPGQYSGVIPLMNPATRQPYGFRIVKLITKESAGQRDLNDPRVQQAIREQLRDRREQLLKAAYYEMLRNEAKVKNHFAEQLLNNAGQK